MKILKDGELLPAEDLQTLKRQSVVFNKRTLKNRRTMSANTNSLSDSISEEIRTNAAIRQYNKFHSSTIHSNDSYNATSLTSNGRRYSDNYSSYDSERQTHRYNSTVYEDNDNNADFVPAQDDIEQAVEDAKTTRLLERRAELRNPSHREDINTPGTSKHERADVKTTKDNTNTVTYERGIVYSTNKVPINGNVANEINSNIEAAQ